jgi:hypothetical protein
LTSLTPEHVRRVSWRKGRAKETKHYGAPYEEGCALAVPKSGVLLPDDKKLAWIIVIDDEVRAMVDAENNALY